MLIAGIYSFTDGCEMSILSLLGIILQEEWNLSSSQVGLFGAMIFTGIILGSIISSLISDD
jgi:hypothetical protein